ncbi:glycosyltransferase family 4 protein [Megamonas hypermegale]|uniref:glycosyltransferase family 4 protein n=1 Tax=Megamonas hypermegale TaxID=158847 RepID=UPI0026EE4507|nr:glycosyltransferase family 4 protein [Megamonas hypermegale]
MKVIILNDYAYINGGAGKIAIDTALGLVKQNIDVTLFSAVGPISEFLKNVPNLKVICLNQYDILNDPNRLRAIINGIWNFKARKAFENLLRQYDNKETIIHVHGMEKALSSSCINIAVKKGFKVLFHLHEYGIACPNMGFYNYQKQEICKLKPLSWKCIITNCDSRCYLHKCWRVIRQFVQKNIGGVPQNIHYIYISEFSYKILTPFLNKKNKIFYVSNPIDIQKKERIEVENNEEFIFIGRLVPEKNPVLLAKVASEMKLPVTFIGSGVCENEIKKIYPKAKITGWLDKNSIENILKSARCLVFPSNWYECQPLVVLECLAKGIPCISSKICASSESLIDGETGLLFENNNKNDLMIAIDKMKNDEIIRIMSNTAYNDFWNKDYSLKKYINEIIRIYNSILE